MERQGEARWNLHADVVRIGEYYHPVEHHLHLVKWGRGSGTRTWHRHEGKDELGGLHGGFPIDKVTVLDRRLAGVFRDQGGDTAFPDDFPGELLEESQFFEVDSPFICGSRGIGGQSLRIRDGTVDADRKIADAAIG